MKTWATEVLAIDPIDPSRGVRNFEGPKVIAPTRELAQQWLHDRGIFYARVADELIAEVPCKPNTYEPDWDNAIDYENRALN
jgi:hypothetical protein